MKPKQPVTYLTCTKNRSHQRKHIQVCKKCPSNDNCRAFLEYSQLEPLPTQQEHPALERPEIPLGHFITQLVEIRKMVSDDKSAPNFNDLVDTEAMTHLSLQRYLKAELEGIKSLCLTGHSSRR